MPFPTDDSLCERCGYPLKGLSAEAACPECGLAVDASDPRHRTEPPWTHRHTPAAWGATVARLVGRPSATFARLDVGGSNLPPRLFLLTMAAIAGGVWGLGAALLLGRGVLGAWVEGVAAVMACLVLTYVEAAGVAFFARRRGWRVGFRLAERVACYAAVGWPAAAAAVLGFRVAEARLLPRGLAAGLSATPFVAYLPYVIVLGLAMLGFEMLVWLGVRRVRYANAAPRPGNPAAPPA